MVRFTTTACRTSTTVGDQNGTVTITIPTTATTRAVVIAAIMDVEDPITIQISKMKQKYNVQRSNETAKNSQH